MVNARVLADSRSTLRSLPPPPPPGPLGSLPTRPPLQQEQGQQEQNSELSLTDIQLINRLHLALTLLKRRHRRIMDQITAETTAMDTTIATIEGRIKSSSPTSIDWTYVQE